MLCIRSCKLEVFCMSHITVVVLLLRVCAHHSFPPNLLCSFSILGGVYFYSVWSKADCGQISCFKYKRATHIYLYEYVYYVRVWRRYGLRRLYPPHASPTYRDILVMYVHCHEQLLACFLGGRNTLSSSFTEITWLWWWMSLPSRASLVSLREHPFFVTGKKDI